MEFGSKLVFSDLSAVFNPGISVVLGSNGSGKTTLLRIISGLQKQTEGELEFVGFSETFETDEMRDIFLCSPDISLYHELTVKENIKFVSELKKAFPDVSGWGVEDHLDKKYGELSSGYKQRIKLIVSFLINPEILLLDEPEQHMDENGILKLTDEIEKRNRNDLVTIVATNHLWRNWDVVVKF
ncbi:MAG: ATP-binding cassette domain-containing protein [Caldisericia bacterium]